MRRRLKVLLGGLAVAASSIQAQAQQSWPNPYFQYPAPVMAPMGQAAVNYRVVQPVVVYQQPVAPRVIVQPQPQAVRTIQPVRYQMPETPEMPVVAPAHAAVPTIASLAAGQPAMTTSPAPSGANLAIGTTAEPLAPAGPPAAPIPEPKSADIARAPEFDFNDGLSDGGAWTVAFGAGVDIVKPHWKTNPAFTVFTLIADGGEGGDAFLIRQVDFDYDHSAAPFVWGAVQCPSGFGARARGWWYNDSQDLSAVVPEDGDLDSAAPLGLGTVSRFFFVGSEGGDTLTVGSSLRIRTLDLEGTYGNLRGNRRLLASVGARYAYVSQSYRATLTPLDPNNAAVRIDSGHNFSGVGPTLALEGGYILGNSGFALIGSTRGSLLFGSGRQFADCHFSVDGINVAVSARQENDDLLPVWDLELGGEYSRNVGNFNFFFQAAFVAQVWLGAGNAANNDNITVLPEVSDKNADLGLYGLRLTGGFRY